MIETTSPSKLDDADPIRLEVVEGPDLLTMTLEPVHWVIEGLIPEGLTVLSGAPKAGKSWLALDLLIHASRGEPFLGRETRKSDVLYLALEDRLQRLQGRAQEYADELPEGFRVTTSAPRVKEGLIAALNNHVNEYPDTKLIVIDTLAKARKQSERDGYQEDYDFIGYIKKLADIRHVSIVVVHHTRKLLDGDKFDRVLGSRGITGGADGMMILERKFGDEKGTLSISGRDVPDCVLELSWDNKRWSFLREIDPVELETPPTPEVVARIGDWLLARGTGWEGTITELVEIVGIDVKAAVVAKQLSQNREQLSARGIAYSRSRTGSRRTSSFELIANGDDAVGGSDAGDGSDGSDAMTAPSPTVRQLSPNRLLPSSKTEALALIPPPNADARATCVRDDDGERADRPDGSDDIDTAIAN